MSIFKRVADSAHALKTTAVLTGTSLLTAIYVVLHSFTTIVVNAVIQIRFSPLALALTGALYGPVAAGLSGVVGDLIKCVVRPTGGFFPGFTFGEFVRGFIYGLILYKRKPTALRVAAATVCSCVVVDFFLTTLWLTMMGNGAFFALLVTRIVKILIMIPIEFALVYSALKISERANLFTRYAHGR